MRNIGLAPIILLIIFVLIPLVRYILNRMGRRFEHPTPTRQRMPDMGFRRQAAPATATAATRERANVTPPTEAIAPPRSVGSRPGLFKTKLDVRRAIIAMTMLGPCRAYDPPD